MSVHGEYSRSLEALLSDVRKLEAPIGGSWITDLEAARTGSNPDLSSAARNCLEALARIDAARNLSAKPGIGPDTDPLREPFLHLRAHCHAILGIPAP